MKVYVSRNSYHGFNLVYCLKYLPFKSMPFRLSVKSIVGLDVVQTEVSLPMGIRMAREFVLYAGKNAIFPEHISEVLWDYLRRVGE